MVTTTTMEEVEEEREASTLVVLATLTAVTCQLLRLSIDLIQVASVNDKKEDGNGNSGSKNNNKSPAGKNDKNNNKSQYGSTGNSSSTTSTTKSSSTTAPKVAATSSASSGDPEKQSLLGKDNNDNNDTRQQQSLPPPPPPTNFSSITLPRISILCHILLVILFVSVPLVLEDGDNNDNDSIYSSSSSSSISGPLRECTILTLLIGIGTSIRDIKRTRFGFFSRFFYGLATVSLFLAYWGILFWQFYNNTNNTNNNGTNWTQGDKIMIVAISFYMGLTLVDVCVTRGTYTTASEGGEEEADNNKKKKKISLKALSVMLKPYVWPDATDSSALWNRVRAIMTWVSVALGKACSLVSPIFLGWASTALAHQEYDKCIQYSIVYSILQWCSGTLKDGQNLFYLKVAQAAYVELSETTFGHIHALSLDWHLRKKMGEVIRSMDRGIKACDTLMKYLFLWLVPAVVECLLVCIIFASYFHYLPLGITVFYFVFAYFVLTILLTLWRKKFRKAVAKSDNEYNEICTDSLINFETVKYFTAEDYEMKKFGDAVKKYQKGSVDVQASLAFLNISQRLILQACMATSLSLAAYGIQKRSDCCIEDIGCEAVFSDCCREASPECPGMEVGDFVAVLSYVIQLFTPLNFLGSVYNAIVMAVIDLGSLSELLAENAEVTDAPNAKELPKENVNDPDVVVEFDNVVFHYPTQPSTKGLKGLSFKMRKGTTTAVVGPTGAGKTTVSRLLFRFYDVLGGAVKVHGEDVRSLKQQSLREKIGVVPQSASMFNDTIRENMLYGKRDATEEELIQAAKDSQILEFIESLDDGWETIVGDRGLKLSGGEKQRAAIARCLLRDPPIVLLDEATSALDTLTESSVQEALDRLGEERTVLVIAHRLGTIRNADNIIVLKDGVVAEEGTHNELLSKGGVYAEMWNMQLSATSRSTSRSASTNSLTRLLEE